MARKEAVVATVQRPIRVIKKHDLIPQVVSPPMESCPAVLDIKTILEAWTHEAAMHRQMQLEEDRRIFYGG